VSGISPASFRTYQQGAIDFMLIFYYFFITCLVFPGIDPGCVGLPQSKIIMYSFKGVLLSC
jgi:hypothetical protein